ncbi:M23 family metallopeptidase [Nocardioides sp.]|uniref:M23 family metallopeptidase n=1 Tax=Nocardioides sp. TaxID=35761 RepID=UPI003563DBAF
MDRLTPPIDGDSFMGNHRAQRHGHSRGPSETVIEPTAAAGRRKAVKEPGRRARRHSGSRSALFRGLPSAPILLGVAALAISTGGAVSAADAGLVPTSSSPTSQASALTGASDVASVNLLAARRPAVSRDARRDAPVGDKLMAKAEKQAEQRNTTLAKFAAQAEVQARKIAANQWVLPISGYRLTATFGEYGLWSSYHTGLDFAAPSGTPLVAIANGVITSAGYDGAYGNKTVLTLEDGTELWYAHQTSFAVSVGQQVRAGDLIGYVGSTGNVTGPHLHLEVRPGGGDPVNPYTALAYHGITP